MVWRQASKPPIRIDGGVSVGDVLGGAKKNPVIRDHRDNAGPVIRDRRDNAGPVIRDHRK